MGHCPDCVNCNYINGKYYCTDYSVRKVILKGDNGVAVVSRFGTCNFFKPYIITKEAVGYHEDNGNTCTNGKKQH